MHAALSYKASRYLCVCPYATWRKRKLCGASSIGGRALSIRQHMSAHVHMCSHTWHLMDAHVASNGRNKHKQQRKKPVFPFAPASPPSDVSAPRRVYHRTVDCQPSQVSPHVLGPRLQTRLIRSLTPHTLVA